VTPPGSKQFLRAELHAKVIRVDASDSFLGQLAGVADPEVKRKIIGAEFVIVFKQEAAKLTHAGARGAKWLAQGTIYPDVIESGGAKTKKALTIKSHHNVGGLPAELGLKRLEPLRDLFKDEVRELGVAAVCAAEEGQLAHHQRGSRHQSGGLRSEQQAAGDDRVGVTGAWNVFLKSGSCGFSLMMRRHGERICVRWCA